MPKQLSTLLIRSTLLALVLMAFVPPQLAAQNADPHSPIAVPNPATDLWRAVRQHDAAGQAATSQVRGTESTVLISNAGEQFRQFRMNQFVEAAAWVIGVAATLIAVFYLIRGKIPVPGGMSGKLMRRFSDFDRLLHWFTAVVFIVLALTGLVLIFGRFAILPVLGPEALGVIAEISKFSHNVVGPLFLVSVVLLFIRFAVRNLPARGDLTWLLKGGGIIGKSHVSAGYFNAGEKVWFWSVMVLGITVSISGLILYFPIFGQGREMMQLALIVHGITAVLFTAGSFGHIYIGTIGTEGSLASMTTGYVDENWAKAHHDLWYEDVRNGTDAAASRQGNLSGAGTVPSAPDKA